MNMKATSRATPAAELGEHRRVRPSHRVVPVGLDPIGDADHHEGEPDAEGDVAEPVDAAPGAGRPGPRASDRPRRAEGAEGHRDEEDQPPVDRGQQSSHDEADERAADPGDVVDAEGEAALVLREGVGQDRRGVGDEEGGPDALHDAEDDEVEGTGPARSASRR